MTRLMFVLALAAALAACEASAPSADSDRETAASNSDTMTPGPADRPAASAAATAPADPGPTPDVLVQPAAAVAVLQSYCGAIARKDYAAAYALWGDKGRRSGMSEAEFAASLAPYDAFDCDFLPPRDAEGAAGSSYLTVPVRVTGTLASGGGFTLEGPILMRRVNDVPGSSARERQWHIEKSGLERRP